jgi:hypothetical protein
MTMTTATKPPYTVENTQTGVITTHKTWHAAIRAASQIPSDKVIILAHDSDMVREYNKNGEMLLPNGQFE